MFLREEKGFLFGIFLYVFDAVQRLLRYHGRLLVGGAEIENG